MAGNSNERRDPPGLQSVPGKSFAPNRRDDMSDWTRLGLPVNGVQHVQNFGKPSEAGTWRTGRDCAASASRTTSANAPGKAPDTGTMYPLQPDFGWSR